jgi:hypothetical protein
VFSTSSSGGEQVITRTVSTFRALVAEAEFEPSESSEETTLPATPLHVSAASMEQRSTRPDNASSASLHINIQIHISPESSGERTENIFASMANHLYGRAAE